MGYRFRIGALALLAFVTLGCAKVHRQESDYVFRADRSEPVVDLRNYRSVQERPHQRADVALAVSISGGGYRAANFAASVLCELERLEWKGNKADILNEVDYISSVSGGGFAAGVLLSVQYDHLRARGSRDGFSFCEAINEKPDDENDCMMRNLRKGLFERTLLDVRSVWKKSRGDYLERSLDDVFLGAESRNDRGSLVTGDIFPPSDSPGRPMFPYWVPNSTVYENGAIFPHTPDIYEAYGVTEFTHMLKDIRVEGKRGYYAVPLSVGMKASASYPGAYTPTALKTGSRDEKNPYLYLLDGGLADNLGLITAVRLLAQDPAEHKLLVVIDAATATREPFSMGPFSPLVTKIGQRVLDISLDSWLVRYQDMIEKYARGAGIRDLKMVVLDFLAVPEEERKRLLDIKTRLDISMEEQKELFGAGARVVGMRAGDIYCAVFPERNECAAADVTRAEGGKGAATVPR